MKVFISFHVEGVAGIVDWAPDCAAGTMAVQMIAKGSVTRFAAARLHPEEAREMICAGAEAAARRLGSVPVPVPDIELPARLGVEFQTADMARVATWVKGVTRSGTRSVRIEEDDPLQVYLSFAGITYIARVPEGRQ